MTVGDEDHGGIPVTVSIAFGGLDLKSSAVRSQRDC